MKLTEDRMSPFLFLNYLWWRELFVPADNFFGICMTLISTIIHILYLMHKNCQYSNSSLRSILVHFLRKWQGTNCVNLTTCEPLPLHGVTACLQKHYYLIGTVFILQHHNTSTFNIAVYLFLHQADDLLLKIW